MKGNVVSSGSVSSQGINNDERDGAGFFDFAAGYETVFHEYIQIGVNYQADVQSMMAAGVLSAVAPGRAATPSATGIQSVAAAGVPSLFVPVTKIVVDNSAPIVLSFAPVDGGARAEVGSNITITFNKTVKAGSGVIEIHAGSPTGALVESFNAATSNRLSFSASKLTIDPTANLDYGKDYYVTIATGAVKDIAGRSYAGTKTYDFMTKVAGSTWSSVSGHGLLNVDYMLETATGTAISDEPLFGDGTGVTDWGLNKVQAPDAWKVGYTGQGVVVAVVDTGVMYTHADLAGQVWSNTAEIAGNGVDDDRNGYVDDIYGYDFVNKDGYAMDDNGHGTHVAGIIAGLRNDVGVTGVAYGATIMPVKVLDATDHGTFDNIAAGILYAVNNGADVINLSLGGSASSSVNSSIAYAISHGVIVCMAAGNESQSTPTSPAILAQSVGGIAVGAINSSNAVASFSNSAGTTTPYDYVEAPGEIVYSTYNDGGYIDMDGTSMATPYVSGAAALLLSARSHFASNWSTEQLEAIITSTATTMGTAALTTAKVTTTSTLAAASISSTLPEIDLAHLGIIDTGVDAQHVELTGVVSGAEMFMV